jgi:hypothetical protein
MSILVIDLLSVEYLKTIGTTIVGFMFAILLF